MGRMPRPGDLLMSNVAWIWRIGLPGWAGPSSTYVSPGQKLLIISRWDRTMVALFSDGLVKSVTALREAHILDDFTLLSEIP